LALETLDTRGLLCPLPVIRTQDRIQNLEPGSLLEVTATDAGTLHDIPAWCRVHGHELLTTEQIEEDAERGKLYRFTIRVSARY
jgi:TusA-related sulfurtransferase